MKPQEIRGVNLGGWLLMEGYILGGRNIPESLFKDNFKKIYGEKELKKFEKLFRDNFIKELDFKNIKDLGANTIRVPFNYRLIEKSPFSYDEEGFLYLDKIFDWSQKYDLKIILDLHAAVGAQNCDWHSDSLGKALLWEEPLYQKRNFSLWQKLVERFKNKESLLGYDLINEPVLGKRSVKILKNFYKELIRCIRALDKEHFIFLEGDIWAQRIDFLSELISEKISISIHVYNPLDYTFNFTPLYKYPGTIEGVFWSKETIFSHLKKYYDFSLKNKVSIFVGEFGINWRGGFFGELNWLEDILEAFREYNFGYTYWTYKAVRNSVFPDGLYQYVFNSKYINRQGPIYGWETYLEYWKEDKEKIKEIWATENYLPNQEIISLLKKFFLK